MPLDINTLIQYFYLVIKFEKMEQVSVLGRTNINDKLTRSNFDEKLLSGDRPRTNPVMENILSEGGNDFFQYLSWIGLEKEPNLMVLSSIHHYYYDHNDLKGIRTLINLKKLNQVRHLESFLHTLYRILPSKAYFVGCFKKGNHNGNGATFYRSARFFNGLINIFDTRTDRSLSRKGVTKLLEDHGFKVNDFTDINGTTYFWAQNIRKPSE
jgi:hypothetical protein